MKTTVAWILAILSFIGFDLRALPVGNPSDTALLCNGIFFERCCDYPWDPSLPWSEWFSLRLGYYGDFVFDRNLKTNTHENHSTIERTKINTNALLINVNFIGNFDLFGTFGNTDINVRAFGNAFNVINSRKIIDTETDFSWSLGARGILWNCRCFAIGLESQYFYTKPNINYFKPALSPPIYLDNVSLKYQEWQVGLGASYYVILSPCDTAVVPYIAVKWAQVRVDVGRAMLGIEGALLNLKNQRNFGYAIGLTIIQFGIWDFALEGRFVDEKALYINSQVRF